MSHEGQIKILGKIEIEAAAYPSVSQQAYALPASLFLTSSEGKLQRKQTKLRHKSNLGSKQVTTKNDFSYDLPSRVKYLRSIKYLRGGH